MWLLVLASNGVLHLFLPPYSLQPNHINSGLELRRHLEISLYMLLGTKNSRHQRSLRFLFVASVNHPSAVLWSELSPAFFSSELSGGSWINPTPLIGIVYYCSCLWLFLIQTPFLVSLLKSNQYNRGHLFFSPLSAYKPLSQNTGRKACLAGEQVSECFGESFLPIAFLLLFVVLVQGFSTCGSWTPLRL